MSRITHLLALRIVPAAVLLGISLILPATADGQTGGAERALLNYAVAAPQVASTGAFWAPGPGIASTGLGEGERALLGHTGADPKETSYSNPAGTDAQVNRPPVNGGVALRGKWIEQ